MIYTIIRDKWLRGGAANARLLNRTGKMCCLGFVCQQEGATDDELRMKSFPSSQVRIVKSLKLHGFLGRNEFNSIPSDEMIKINDDGGLPEEEREHLLKIEASKLGHTLIFV